MFNVLWPFVKCEVCCVTFDMVCARFDMTVVSFDYVMFEASSMLGNLFVLDLKSILSSCALWAPRRVVNFATYEIVVWII
jgi:hypothetical protein